MKTTLALLLQALLMPTTAMPILVCEVELSRLLEVLDEQKPSC